MSADPQPLPPSGLAKSLRERFVELGFPLPSGDLGPARSLVAARERLTNGIALYLTGNAARRAALVNRLRVDVGTLLSAGEEGPVADAAQVLATRLGEVEQGAVGSDPLLQVLLAPRVVEELRVREVALEDRSFNRPIDQDREPPDLPTSKTPASARRNEIPSRAQPDTPSPLPRPE
jgi:hypothetical protein